VPRLPPSGSSEPAGSLCGDPPLRQNPCGGAESSTGSREIPVRSGGRAGNGAFQAPSMHPDSHLVVPYMLPSFANALCQRWHQRPGRGRLSVGSQSTTGEPAGRKPLKSRKARKLLHCPDGAAPPSCPSWFHRPQCLVPLPPAMLGANGGCTATGGGGMKVEGDHRKVNRAAAKQVLLSAQACAQRISAGR